MNKNKQDHLISSLTEEELRQYSKEELIQILKERPRQKKDHAKKSQSQLKQFFESNEGYLETYFDSLVDLVLIVDWKGVIKGCNRAVESALSVQEGDVIGKDISTFLQRGPNWLSYTYETENGDEFFSPNSSGSETFCINGVCRGRIQTPSNLYFPIIYTSSPTEDTEYSDLVVTIKDVSDMVEMEKELENQKKRTINSERFASLGLLASGIGHEINNPLGVIKGMNFFVKRILESHRTLKEDETSDILKKVGIIDDCVDRISAIVDGLRTMARADTNHMAPLNSHTYIEKTVGMVREVYAREGVNIALDLKCENPFFIGNIGKFQQILMNLLSNAKDAVEDRTDKEICVKTKAEGGQIIVAISDTGCGIPEEYQQNIFDSFFTTKEVGKGTGMGLSLTYTLVEEMGGGIEFKSRTGGGATFVLRFAQSFDDDKTVTHKSEEAESSQKLHGKVLVVDDESLLRELTTQLLEGFGLTVKEASDGDQALKKIKEEHFDVLLTDLKMPKMSGKALIGQIREEGLDNNLKVAVITGGVATEYSKEKRDELRNSIDAYIKKPFDSEEIYQKLKNLLEAQLSSADSVNRP